MARAIRGPSGSALVLPLLAAGASVFACNTKDDGPEQPFAASVAPTPGPQPKFQHVVSLASPPPPISGGTLAIAKDGRTAVAADPDRDLVYVVDIATRTVKFTIPLAPGAEPGRVAFDVAGRAHVALRSAGRVASIDPASGAMTERQVCVAPRGLAYDAKLDALHVACAEGYLVTMPLDGGALRRLGLDRDVRDVVVTRDRILVSRFRNADVIQLTRDGQVAGKATTHGGNLGWRIAMPPPTDETDETAGEEPASAEPAIVSQEPTNPTGTVAVGYYGSGPPRSGDACFAPTVTATRLDIPGRASILVPPAVLPVDLATNGREYAIVAAGNGHTSELPQVFVHHLKPQSQPPSSSSSSGFGAPSTGSSGRNTDCTEMTKAYLPGQAVAAAFDGHDDLIIQSREPASLFIMSPDRQRVWKEIRLSDVSREDTGHAIFHSNSGGFLACASCHAEGGEDGRTWTFVEGDRRTPTMRGTLAHSAPFHWDGAIKDLRHLVDHVFTTRMSGPTVKDDEVGTLQKWLFALPPPAKIPQDQAAATRGEEIFRQRGCASCHSGESLTNNETRDVGTGGAFQVPSLVGVSWRGPFLHNGCAKTLEDRFDPACGGDKHGDVADLDRTQISDLATYLKTL
jgi:mono/diheme cytochrome c family protein